MAETISWVATVATVLAALMTASNIGSRVTGYGFAVFTIGAVCWSIDGAITGQPALLWTNVVLLAVDLFGVWRWLGRQVRVEEGARSAAEASEGGLSETLFPVSLMSRAPVVADGIEGLRRAHYPAERNQVPAHLTMFHALPPSSETELRRRLALAVRAPPPSATIAGLMDLGGGVAFRVISPDLDRLREELAADLHGLLGAQDSGGWRPHVTIQNKVAPKAARALIASLQGEFAQRPLGISGLALHRYLGGPWEAIARLPFRGA